MNAPAEPLRRELVYRQTAKLVPYARNARTHSKAQVQKIVASIREFSFTNPVLIDEHDGIIAGHGRVLAAMELQLAEVPCIVLVGLSQAQKKAYVLADNKIALGSGWDWDMLAIELQDIAAGEFDMGLTGFSEAEIAKLTGQESTAPVLTGLAYKVIIDCADEKHQITMIQRLEAEGLKCKPLMI